MGLTWGTALQVANPLQGAADLTGYSAQQLNEKQFREQMDFAKYQFKTEQEMANTAHQREVADLKAAGINPILSAGGQGAGNASSVGMPGIPDNTATQKGMSAILNTIMTIAPQIAQMKQATSAVKNANAASKVADAQSTKLLAEAGKIATERDINNFIKKMKEKEWNNYDDILGAQISKSPYWMVKKLKEMFKTGSDSAFAKDIDNTAFNLLPNYTEGAWKNTMKDKTTIQQQTGMWLIKLLFSLI